jgi:RTX calcium-binding nonapeptide repeat (4 copies)
MRGMRKTVMLLVLVAALLALGAGAALASAGSTSGMQGAKMLANQRIQCTGVPCVGTGTSDLIFERIGNGKKDRILLRGGDDQVRANAYSRDRDIIKGSSGDDLIYTDDADKRDRIYGGKGNDKCYVTARREAVSGCAKVIVQ